MVIAAIGLVKLVMEYPNGNAPRAVKNSSFQITNVAILHVGLALDGWTTNVIPARVHLFSPRTVVAITHAKRAGGFYLPTAPLALVD